MSHGSGESRGEEAIHSAITTDNPLSVYPLSSRARHHTTEIYIRGASANERLMKFDASINQQRRASEITAADIRASGKREERDRRFHERRYRGVGLGEISVLVRRGRCAGQWFTH